MCMAIHRPTNKVLTANSTLIQLLIWRFMGDNAPQHTHTHTHTHTQTGETGHLRQFESI